MTNRQKVEFIEIEIKRLLKASEDLAEEAKEYSGTENFLELMDKSIMLIKMADNLDKLRKKYLLEDLKENRKMVLKGFMSLCKKTLLERSLD